MGDHKVLLRQQAKEKWVREKRESGCTETLNLSEGEKMRLYQRQVLSFRPLLVFLFSLRILCCLSNTHSFNSVVMCYCYFQSKETGRKLRNKIHT